MKKIIKVVCFASTVFGGFAQNDNTKADTTVKSLQEVVVTANRMEIKKKFLPQKLEIITGRDIEMEPSVDVGDIIKKMGSLDVIQRPNVATYATIRGFRPPVEPGRINPEVTVLINGRQSGTQNLALFDPNSIERIEILKGAAGAIYGSSTMGGLINIITKKNTGKISGNIYGGYGSFKTSEMGLSIGGNITSRLDFNFSGTFFDRNDDFTFGNGNVFRKMLGSEQVALFPTTGTLAGQTVMEFDTAFDGQKRNGTQMGYRSNHLRVGYQISNNWRIDASLNSFSGRGIESSGDLRNLDSQQGSANRFFNNGDIALTGIIKKHKLSFLVYQTEEENSTFNNFGGTIVGPTPTYQRSQGNVKWQGFQAQDFFNVNQNLKFTIGFDFNEATSRTRLWSQGAATTGFKVTESSPSTPFSFVKTFAPFAQAHFTTFKNKLIINPSMRYDMIDFGIDVTPLFLNLTPKSESNTFFSPSLALQYNFNDNLAVHSNIGRAFRFAQAFEIAGYFEEYLAGNKVRITKGNPDLKNEQSVTWDAGIKYNNNAKGLGLDITYFKTNVENRVRQVAVLEQVGKTHTDNRIIDRFLTYSNADQAIIQGLEITGSYDFGSLVDNKYSLRLFTNITHLIQAEDITKGDATKPDVVVRIRNVAPMTINSGIEYDNRKNWSIRLSNRFVGKRYGQDFGNLNPALRGAFMEFPKIMTLDMTVNYTINRQHTISLRMSNITDENYYETRGFNQPGRATNLRYTFRF
jgi:vitamin B12 transporter